MTVCYATKAKKKLDRSIQNTMEKNNILCKCMSVHVKKWHKYT